MFSTLGLFGSTACPDAHCQRVGCPFGHGASSSAAPGNQGALNARKLLGFSPLTQARPPSQAAGPTATKRAVPESDLDTAGQKEQRQVKAKADPRTSSSSSAGTTPASSSSRSAVNRGSASGGTSSIASLRAQAREAAVPALSSAKRTASGASSASRTNALASSSRSTLDPPPKSSLLQRPPPAFGVAPVRSNQSGTSVVEVRTRTQPKVTTTVVRSTSHLIPTTARSTGSSNPSSRNAEPEVRSRHSGQAKPDRPQPDAPRLSLRPNETVVPLKSRNKGLDVLFKEFLKLYEPLEATDGWELVGLLAGEDALAQEAECYAKGGKTGYANAITNTMTAIRKRPPPTSTSHPSVGLQSAYIKAVAELTASAASRLTAPIITALVHPREELERYGYLVDVPDVEGGQRPTEEGLLKVCDRCKVEFIVGEAGAKCWYHWGRARYGKDQGIRTQLATCCGVPWTNQGCTTSTYHVFKESDPLDLHARTSFISTADLPTPATPTRLDVVGLDCEMLYSTAGMTLARVTVVDEDGKSLLDELVRPEPASVLDHNTRFSGIKPGEVENAAMNLDRVRDALGTLIGPDTAIIGHGLENDLNALRLVHSKVIDTALLFPHPSGPPYRLALRDLMMKHLQKVIQNAGASGEGHSSLEDAAGSVELVRQRAKDMRERQS